MGPEDAFRDDELAEQAEQPGTDRGNALFSKPEVSVALPLGGKQAVQFFSLAPFAVAIFDRDLRYIAASKRWLKDYRLNGKRVLGKTQYEVFPNMTGAWRDRYQRCLAGEKFDEQESEFNGRHGIEWISWKMHPWTDDDGVIAGVILFTEFISDQKRRSLELERNQQFLETVLESIHDGVMACDVDGKINLVNSATRNIVNATHKGVPVHVGSPLHQIYRADSLEPIKKEDTPLARALRGEEVDGEEVVLAPNTDDEQRIVARSKAMYDASGAMIGAVASMHNITEEWRVSEQLRERERRYRFLYNKTPAMLHSVDREGRLIRVSDFWVASLGYKREEVIGREFQDYLSPSSREYARTILFPQFLQTGHIKNVELEVVKKNGEIINAQLTTSAERDDKGEIANSLSVLTDITARKKAETKLKRSEKQFHAAFQASPLGMALISPTSDWIEVNAAFCQIIGYDIDELFSFNIRDITHPDDLKADAEHLKQLLEGAKDSFQLEKRYIHKDGSTVWVSVSVILIRDANDEPVHFVTQVLNLTDRKHMERALRRSEEQFRSAFETSPQGMALVAPGGRWLTVNEALCGMFGYSKKEFLEKGIETLTHPDDLDSEVEDIRKLLRGEAQSFEMEKRYLHKSGTTIWGQVSISLIRDEAGAPAQFVFQMLDLTKRREAEQQLVQSQKLEAIGQLTGGLAHDFNNLLAVILISLQLLERSHADDPKSIKRIRAALDATERGADLTHRLLAFSRKQSLEQKVIDVPKLVEGMTGLLKRTLGGSVNLQTQYEEDLATIEVDQSQLETGLLNLAINARDAMPDGGDLTIEACNVIIDEAYAGSHSEVRPGRYVLIAVTDTGTGMSSDVIEKVFQPFFTTKEVGKGTGLGLSMLYGFVKQSKGHIEVYSEQGIGTSIKLYLPVLVDGQASALSDVVENETEVVGGDEIILVTEDDHAVRHSVCSLFKSLGYRVVEAENGNKAVKILNSDTPIDLLFSDIVMPGGMDGIALAEKAAVLRPGVKILLTTGFAEGAVARTKMLDANMEIIGKPYRREDVARKIRGVLDA